MKEDARVRYTKKALRDALFTCLKTKQLQDITVKEISETANLNRATFYKHYRDCFDLLEQIENEMLSDFKALLDSHPNAGNSILSNLIQIHEKYSDLQAALSKGVYAENLQLKIKALMHEYMYGEFTREMPNATHKEIEMTFTLVSTAFFQLTIRESENYSSQEVIDYMNTVVPAIFSRFK